MPQLHGVAVRHHMCEPKSKRLPMAFGITTARACSLSTLIAEPASRDSRLGVTRFSGRLLLPGQRAVQKRRGLLAIASELFLVKGYDGVTLDEIVAAAGGSKSTIYKHFHGKEGVFVAAIEALCSEILSKIFLSKPYDGSLREALRVIGLAIYDGILSPRAIELQRLVIAEAHRFPEVSRIWYENGPASSYRWLAAFLAERERSGEVRIFDTRTAAVLFHDMLIYEIHQQVLLGLIKKPGRAALEVRIEDTIRVLLESSIVR
jgi:TetR/AcrR family transcriptional repressor of mexJK operon